MKQKLFSLFIALLFTAPILLKAQSSSSWTRANIMAYLKRDARQTDDLYPIVGHRGYWRGEILNSTGKYYPENSLSAITRAHNTGIEAVELDVRIDVNGVPIIMHDLSVGRTTNQNFNPITGLGYNPLVKNMDVAHSASILRAWNTATNQKVISSSATQENIPTLYDAVRHVIVNDLKVILILDIFSAEDLKIAYDRVVSAGGNTALSFVIFKIGGKNMGNDTEVYQSLGLLNSSGQPTSAYYYFNLVVILYEDSPASLYNYVYNQASVFNVSNRLVFVELVNKSPLKNSTTPYLNDVADVCFQAKIRVGQYWAKPTSRIKNKNNILEYGYFTGSGYGTNIQTGNPLTQPGECCDAGAGYSFLESLDNIMRPFYPNNPEPANGGVGATIITSDAVEELKVEFGPGAGNRNKRNTNWYKCGASTCPTGLRIINDTDKVYILSKDVSPNVIDGETVIVYPNPVQNELRLSFNAANVADVQVSLTDMQGKIIIVQKHKSSIGSNIIVLNTQAITNGIYLVRIQMATKLITKKVIVSK